MDKDKTDLPISRKLAELREKRNKILVMQSEEAINTILDSRDALPLVHSFSEEDFYIFINDIGLQDCLPILSMASNKQWEYILDLDMWEKDRVNIKPAIGWLNMLLSADSKRLIHWLGHEKSDLFELLLFRNISVAMREHDQDPSELGDGFITLDDVFYFKFKGLPLGKEEKDQEDEWRGLFYDLLKKLADSDHERYQSILLEAMSIIPAETEEEEYRLRNIRLAEKGFLPFDEAVGIYEPLGREVENFSRMRSMPKEKEILLPVSIYPGNELDEKSLFAESLAFLGDQEMEDRMRTEFASLCNCIISADGRMIRSKAELASVVNKACGYIGLGMARMAGKGETPSPAHCGNIIKNYSLVDIFRYGYDLGFKLKLKAEKWSRQSWFKARGLKLGFWDEEGLGVLGGLFLKRPMFFDNYKTGDLYREFSSMEDIEATSRSLEMMMEIDYLFSILGVDIPSNPYPLLNYKVFLLTLWGRNHQGLSLEMAPMDLGRFMEFYKNLFSIDTGKIRKTMIEDLFSWLSKASGLKPGEINQKIRPVMAGLFSEIEEEYGKVKPEDLDPVFIRHFWVNQSI